MSFIEDHQTVIETPVVEQFSTVTEPGQVTTVVEVEPGQSATAVEEALTIIREDSPEQITAIAEPLVEQFSTVSEQGPLGATGPGAMVWFVRGLLFVASGVAELPVLDAITIVKLGIRVAVAPIGAAILVDLLKNGTSVLSPSYLTIPDGQFWSGVATVNIAAVAGDYFSANIVQVGSSTPGSTLTLVGRQQLS